MQQSLRGDRLGGNERDMEPDKLQFDPRVVKIGKLAEMHSALDIVATKPNGTFTGLMEYLLYIIYFASV